MEHDPIKELATRIRQRREALGLTLEQVGAAFAGTVASRRKRVWAWESGTVNIGARELLVLAQVLNTDAAWLLTGRAAWPFEHVDRTRYEALDTTDRVFVQAKLDAAIEDRAARKANPTDQNRNAA